MVLRKKLVFTIFIINKILTLISSQEYIKELKPKEFKFISYDKLPPVELPRPVLAQRITRDLNDEQTTYETINTDSRLQKSQRPTLMEVALEASVREGLNAMIHLYSEVEPNMIKNGQLLQQNHPAALLSKFSAPLVETTQREMAAYATLTATKIFRKSYDLSNDLARQAHSQKVSLRRTALESLCPQRDPPTCMPASERYRTHDGTCNNKKRLRWGAAQMPFNRFLPPEYADGVDTTRKAADGGPLSSSRFVSLLVHGARDGEAPLTLMLAQWGQLLDHDMTSTAQPRSINGSVPSCCGSKDFHPSCFPIKVPLDDPWLSPLKVRCLEFLRSAPAQRRDCVLSWREQTNQATSYIDASPIYSSSVKFSDNARVFRKGLLIFGRGNPADDVCQRGAIAAHCIRSGDGRSGEQPGLLALHQVWVHEHNHIAMKLSEINLHWSDEKIYQETRRIIGAMFQHITFREFLPIVLGSEVLKLFDLELLTTGYYEGYDPKINPTVANAFAAAAFRFGHSLVQNSYMRCDRFHNVISNNVSLHEEFQRGDIGSVGSLNRLLRGMATQRALKRDEFITPELTNHLFQTPGFPFGLDLAAINVQRGRDHGIPPYTHWRVPCGLSAINSWEDLANVVGSESARRISHAYRSVNDIDLFVGGIAERPVVGGLVGPTFACIIAQQFSNSRKGDRFWYENAGFESSFTPAQLHSIRRVSLASVLCRAVGGGTFQPHIFLPPELPHNERLPCGAAALDDFDIGPWLEQDPFAALGITHTPEQQPPQPTFKPTTLKSHTLPERIFDSAQIETKSPDNTDSPHSDKKIGFPNRNPITRDPSLTSNNILTKPASNGFLITSNSSKINDKLDINKKSNTGHITKQKPIPGVNNKLDKNSRTGGNRHNVQNTSRRTIIVNNIPIELRNSGGANVKKVSSNSESKLEPRNGNIVIVSPIAEIELNKTENTEDHISEEMIDTTLTKPQNIKHKRKAIKETDKYLNNLRNEEPDSKESHLADLHNKIPKNKTTNVMTTPNTSVDMLTPNYFELEPQNLNKQNDSKNTTHQNTFLRELSKQVSTELKNATSKDMFDSDIDPLMQTIPIAHKRVQRKLNSGTVLDQYKEKFKHKPLRTEFFRNTTQVSAYSNRSTSTKSPKTNRTTLRTTELRQFQNRPSYSKAPQKVVVDSVNGDNQYEIEINIRQTNKSPKPLQTTPHKVDYTNNYKPNQIDRYSSYLQTTPTYAYYQPGPTQISSLTQNQRTKPPTIIFVDEHEEHKTSKLPGFLQSIVGWNRATRRPLAPSVDFNDKPNLETIIGSPHSIANIQPAYQKPHSHSALPAATSSFSQAQVETAGIVQASSASMSSGNFGSIAGFASANGADSTFSFNIRPKPDKTQSNGAASYGLELPQHNPWYAQKPSTAQHLTNYDLPYRENIHSPFSTSNKNYYLNKNGGLQRKESLTLTPAHDFANYDYSGRTLRPLSNVTFEEETGDNIEDYEYDDDYGTSPLIKNFNEDGYLRPEHMLGTILKANNNSATTNETLDDDYVLPALNMTKNLPIDEHQNLPTPINTNFSADFPDAQGKNSKNYILAEDDNPKANNSNTNNTKKLSQAVARFKTTVLRDVQQQRNGNRHDNNKRRNHEKIAFAPINILTKPERPDNWVFYDSPLSQTKEAFLPEIPKLVTDPLPSAEFPRPFKKNIWLDLSKFKTTATVQFEP